MITQTEKDNKYAAQVTIDRLVTRSNFTAPKRSIEWQSKFSLLECKSILWQYICYVVKATGGNEPHVLKDQFNEIAEWLYNNDGKGLFLYGNCGQGKTMLARHVIPMCLSYIHDKIVHYYEASDIYDNPLLLQEAMRYAIVSVDDIGTEGNSAFKDQAFSRLIDNAEKRGKIVIATTNLNEEKLIERYSTRVIDRIKGNMRRVLFDGKDSFRQ